MIYIYFIIIYIILTYYFVTVVAMYIVTFATYRRVQTNAQNCPKSVQIAAFWDTTME